MRRRTLSKLECKWFGNKVLVCSFYHYICIKHWQEELFTIPYVVKLRMHWLWHWHLNIYYQWHENHIQFYYSKIFLFIHKFVDSMKVVISWNLNDYFIHALYFSLCWFFSMKKICGSPHSKDHNILAFH